MYRRSFLFLASLVFKPNGFPDAFNKWADFRNSGTGGTVDVREYALWANLKKEWIVFKRAHDAIYRK